MRFIQGAGVASLALATLFAVQCVAKDAAFFEDFGSGWDSRWVQSGDDKYTGKFAAETPKGLDDQALKVTRTRELARRCGEHVNTSRGFMRRSL